MKRSLVSLNERLELTGAHIVAKTQSENRMKHILSVSEGQEAREGLGAGGQA
jgi:hypothetical protein